MYVSQVVLIGSMSVWLYVWSVWTEHSSGESDLSCVSMEFHLTRKTSYQR